MEKVFDCRINTHEYLSFFRGYMFGDLNIEKDLGKTLTIKANGRIRSTS
jgi:hypothetical protein